MNHLPFTSLWVFPPNYAAQSLKTDGTVHYVPVTAFYTEGFANEHWAEQNNFDRFTDHRWRTALAKPVNFRRVRSLSTERARKDAPLEMWVLIDLYNGDPRLQSGKLYLFCFKTREEARTYRANLRLAKKSNDLLIEVSSPIQLFQR